MFIQRKRRAIRANEEMMEMEGGVNVAPEATDLLFEAEDVAELVAEVTGETVEVEADGDVVTFAVGEEEFTVEADGDEEILESVRRNVRGKSRVAASRRPAASRRNNTVRKNPSRR